MKKILGMVFVVVVVLVAGLYLGRNVIARSAVEAGAKEMTGFPLKIGSLDLAFGESRIAVRDIQLLNPPEFKEPVFVEMPELTVDYDTGSLLGDTPHLKNLVVDLKRIVIVRTKEGESNVMKLKGAVASKDGAAKPKVHYKIDTFRLKIGTVEFKDYKAGNPAEKSMALNLDDTYKNFTDATEINRLVLLTVVKKAKLPFIGIDATQLAGSLGNITNSAGEAVKGLADSLGKVGSGAADSVQQVGKGLFNFFSPKSSQPPQ